MVKGGNWKGSLRASAGAGHQGRFWFGGLWFHCPEGCSFGKTFGGKGDCFRPYVDAKLAEELDVELVELDYLLEHSDYVSLHAPLLAILRHMIDEAQLASMKKRQF